ncbi:MAG: hypothetical protein ACREJC_12510 [Tepidisphaeraceae bacterium]
MKNVPRALRISALILFSLILSKPALAGKFEFGLEFWPPSGKEGDEDQISWKSVLTEVKGTLGRAKQFNWFIDACYAGQAITQSDPTSGTDLAMPHTISTATTADRPMRFGWSENDQDPPKRIKVGDTYYYSFNDYLTKRLKNNSPVPTVKQLFDAGKADCVADPDIPAGRIPQFVKRGGGDDALKIKGDADKSRTVVFGADMNEMYFEPHTESYNTLKGYTFDSIVLYRHDKQDASGTPPIKGKGTWGNFKGALGDLKTQLAAGTAATQMVNIFHVGHGYRKSLNEDKENNLDGRSGLHEGRIIDGTSDPFGEQLDIPMDAQFWDTLKASLFPTVDEDLGRIYQPRFTLGYSEQDVTAPFSIAIGGVPLGTFELESSATSGQLVVPLNDSFLNQLITTMDGASLLTMQFNLAVGDSIRLGLEDDLYGDPSYLSSTYGAGISTVVAGFPEPGAPVALVVLTLFATRRTRRHAADDSGICSMRSISRRAMTS